jgi:lysophospholipase L1-like esterase
MIKLIALVLCSLSYGNGAGQMTGRAMDPLAFTFGEHTLPGAIQVDEPVAFHTDSPYGFEWIAPDAIFGLPSSPGLQSDQPIVFAIRSGEGNFRVTAHFAGCADATGITIKAESRRLMIHQPDLTCPQGDTFELSFVTNVRTPALAQGGAVAIKPREVGTWHWDDALQLEFHSPFPVLSVRVQRVDAIPVLYLLGDSTVTDQTTEPWIGWGQMLPRFFAPTLSISNHAESGESLRLFREGRRFEKIMDTLKPGDFVMIQFGHNDMKESGPGIGAMTSYASDLRTVIRHIRGAGAEPILVTSMKRRRFDEQGRQFATLLEYPIAVRRVAAELDVPLVDLNWMSGVFYSALGPEGSKSAFVHYPAHTFPGQDRDLRDDTHFNAYGGDELASYVIEVIRTACPSLAVHLHQNLPAYDPSSPRAHADLRVPSSPRASLHKPDGD